MFIRGPMRFDCSWYWFFILVFYWAGLFLVVVYSRTDEVRWFFSFFCALHHGNTDGTTGKVVVVRVVREISIEVIYR